MDEKDQTQLSGQFVSFGEFIAINLDIIGINIVLLKRTWKMENFHKLSILLGS